jgi:hypothetical protein
MKRRDRGSGAGEKGMKRGNKGSFTGEKWMKWE